MSDQNKKIDTGHPSGLSPMDNGQSEEELEGSEKAFRRFDHPLSEKSPEASEEDKMVMGDSRPDDGTGAGWTAAEEHPIYDEDRKLGAGGPINKEDPETLERQRVDQEDEIVAEYDPLTGSEKAVLRPRTANRGTESEGL